MTDEQLLEKIDRIVEKQISSQLAPIIGILNTHSTLLEAHGAILNDHSSMLKAHGKTLDIHSKLFRDLKRKVNKIDWVVNYISKNFDEKISKNTKDIALIKIHVGLPTKN